MKVYASEAADCDVVQHGSLALHARLRNLDGSLSQLNHVVEEVAQVLGSKNLFERWHIYNDTSRMFSMLQISTWERPQLLGKPNVTGNLPHAQQ